MSSYNINLNLSKLKDSFVAAIKGKTAAKKCLCIPLDSDGVYVGEKGIYLDLSAIETKEQKFNQSHFIRVRLQKEVYQQLTEEERKQVPIVGNMKVLERPAVQNQEVEAAAVASVKTDDGMSIDDFPF